MKTALVCGVSGQDGAYLAKLLLEKGYRVVGTSRDALAASFSNLRKLSILEHVECQSLILTDFGSTLRLLSQIQPDEVYNLAGQSSVGFSFEVPVETIESNTIATINLLTSIRSLGGSIRFYHASSSECFGETTREGANETTPFRPRSPYAIAKAAAHWAVVNYREAYGLFACNGILFNHESPLRPERFVTRKIVTAACRIKAKRQQIIRLGNLAIYRDWGWAPQYVDAIWRILQHGEPDDFVVATGEPHSLQDFVESTFEELGLDWRDHVEHDDTLIRPSELKYSRGNPSKTIALLGWKPTCKMSDVVRMMIRAELSSDAAT